MNHSLLLNSAHLPSAGTWVRSVGKASALHIGIEDISLESSVTDASVTG